MPLYKTITVTEDTKVLIWKIEESFESLYEGLKLTPNCEERVAGMKSDIHRRGFLSVRYLLSAFGYTAADLYYDSNGKPHLTDDKYISISHSFTYAAVVVSNKEVGIDIEMQRNKIIRIANKFTTLKDYEDLKDEESLVRKLTKVWCAKESLYKLYATPGLSFLQHIYVRNFELNDTASFGSVTYEGASSDYTVDFLEFDGFTCAYTLPKL